MTFKILAAAALATVALTATAHARDQIRIVGSSTVYPFATAVAEQFGKTSGFKTPVVESTGTGGGLKLFCAGADENSPDITNASRRIKQSEIDACAANGVKDVSEIVIGYDGIVIAKAKSGKPLALSREQIFKAIAKTIPQGGKLVANPYKKWSDIDPALPKDDIVVFGPASNHGTRDALVELVMDEACDKFPEIKALSGDSKKVACEAVREDGAFVEVSENYTVTLQKLTALPYAVGILSYSYLDQNGDKIQGATVDGQAATYENIAVSKYPLSRPLFFYVKKGHVGVIPGVKEYIAEFTSDKAWGKDGYLSAKGLIASPDAQRKEEAAKSKELPNVKL
ncbi:substrate-binding domain-containing protein [Telmatospirillum siberiense]|uniref:Phosphate ABC transporter substrate-binding protein n=1 Tax=Telmatospirillum siberiense TaxID=382514 RepID=A0A2N3PNH2_9PROT|nr:substrate-binding domain-containing protein [Telmatospirillum siberiense]PKU21930.1 phosphate ABC transporter substrate-binding protein [Telmatospirillum siberiense]